MLNSDSVDAVGTDLPEKTLAAVRKSSRSSQTTKKKYRPTGEAEYSGARSDDRDPTTLSRGLEDLVQERGWQRQSAVGAVIGRWREVVGPDIADHVVPESFDENAGRLNLAAESTAWATQIRLLIPTILTKLDAEIGQGVVSEINVKGPNAPRQNFGPLRVPGRGPRDTYG